MIKRLAISESVFSLSVAFKLSLERVTYMWVVVMCHPNVLPFHQWSGSSEGRHDYSRRQQMIADGGMGCAREAFKNQQSL